MEELWEDFFKEQYMILKEVFKKDYNNDYFDYAVLLKKKMLQHDSTNVTRKENFSLSG